MIVQLYELLLSHKAIINIVGSYDAFPPPPPPSLPLNKFWCELVAVAYCVQLIFQD